MSPLKLRPHHGLCIPHFQGRGYSPAFVGQMEKVIAALQNNPPVQMVTGGDEICKACPNRQEGVCCYEEKVSRYDQQVLNTAGWRTARPCPGRPLPTWFNVLSLPPAALQRFAATASGREFAIRRTTVRKGQPSCNRTVMSPLRSTTVSPLGWDTTSPPVSSMSTAWASYVWPFWV